MPSAAPAAIHAPQQHYPPTPNPSRLAPTLINTSRPILPLPKRRVPSTATGSTSASSSAAGSSSTLPLPPPQIFTHIYPPASTRYSPPSFHSSGDFESSESDDDIDDTGSTTSSVGREDFNLKNKKKRKIPLSATTSGNVNNAVAEISPSTAMGRMGSSKGRLNGWRVPSATARTEGGYTRRKTRVASRSVSAEPQLQTENGGISQSVTPAKTTGDSTSTLKVDMTSPAPSGPFSFSCHSSLTLPMIPSIPPMGPTTTSYATHPSAPPTSSLPVPPPPPPAVPGQENIPPQQAYPPNQQQQQRLPPQGMKHPNSEKARRVAQLTKLRERYRMGPKPETDDIYICQFCTYGFIYGEEPVYLIRQYNRKRNAEIRLRRERRKMLEKARMKGKKGPLPAAAPPGQQSPTKNEDDAEDDGLCCTCGQQVGQHNHVPPPGGTGPLQQVHGHAPKGK